MPTAQKTPAPARTDAPPPTADHAQKAPAAAQRELALDVPVTARRQPHAGAAERLWFCVWLPALPLEAAGPSRVARAVVEEEQGMHRVRLACPQAAAAGIRPGQSANAALALLPGLVVEERSRLREQQALEALAAWLETFSSVVSVAAADVLLLELAGSLRLFGGLPKLRQELVAGLDEQGYSAAVAIAPTPLAATWLARAGRRVCIREPANLAAALRRLPLACLDWPAATCEALAGMGVGTVGDCLRLPREGFARRFGPRRLMDLDRALGRLPDPRRSWRAPEQFVGEHEMTGEESDRDVLLAICRELLEALERFLLARQLGTLRITFSFFHLRAPATRLTLGCARAERRAGHWSELLGIRFERLTLVEPVIAIRLDGGCNQLLPGASEHLPLAGRSARRGLRYSMAQLAERLVARIGHQSVQGVAAVAEHRPHRAWRLRSLFDDAPATQPGRAGSGRPLWMLPEPAPLVTEDGYPQHDGPLRFVAGPERLETGWWDEGGVARDYYVAVNSKGMRLWIFRNRSRPPGWYLHGFFG